MRAQGNFCGMKTVKIHNALQLNLLNSVRTNLSKLKVYVKTLVQCDFGIMIGAIEVKRKVFALR